MSGDSLSPELYQHELTAAVDKWAQSSSMPLTEWSVRATTALPLGLPGAWLVVAHVGYSLQNSARPEATTTIAFPVTQK